MGCQGKSWPSQVLEQPKQVRFQQTHIQGFRQVLLMVSRVLGPCAVHMSSFKSNAQDGNEGIAGRN